jgi:hypothetical protein
MTQSISLRAARGAALLLAVMLLAACAQTQVVDNWETDQPATNKPDKVAVIAAMPDTLIREAIEVDVASILADKGLPAVPSSRIPGMSGGIRGEIDPEAAARLLRDAKVDGVVVMFYAGGGRSGDYVRSDYWAEYVGTGVGYGWGGYNWARPYFVDTYTIHQGANILDYQQFVYVESSYFDLETEAPVWRIVTKTKDTEHADAAGDIAKKIASEMRSAGLN